MTNAAASPKAAEPTNGASSAWQQWPVERAVARRIGVSQTAIRRLAKSLAINPYEAPDGTKRYDFGQLEQLRAAQAAVEDYADDESDDEDVKPKRGEKSLLAAYAQGLSQAQAHNERLIGIICGPVERILTTYNAHQDRIDRRVADLEKGRDEAAQARSLELQAAHDRDQEAKVIDAALKRKDELFGMVSKKLPDVVDAIAKSAGFGAKAEELTADTLDFLKSLNMMQLGLMLSEEANVTTPAQRELIRKILTKAGVELPDAVKDSGSAGTPAPTETATNETKG